MIALVYLLILLTLPTAAFAHGGGLNKEGCHNNRKTGDYHCHRKRAPKQETLSAMPKLPSS
jgi:hypothetical protein